MEYKRNKKTVFVAMSGGVDSSVAAALLKKEGYRVIGVHMKCFNVDGCAEEDAEDARRAAETLDIPFYVFDFEREYREKVVEYMVSGYKSGITPNPDVMCNKEIKFGLFLEKALGMGADYVATGHYIKIQNAKIKIKNDNLKFKNIYTFYQAKDINKDQSYFLWTLNQRQLKHCLFPIGKYKKPQVRALARKFGLPNSEKKDSQGICFLGKVSLADFLSDYIPEKVGAVLNTSGAVLGEHRGAQFYTIGQRHLKISNFKNQKSKISNDQKPLYVSEKDIKNNTVTVAEGSDNEALLRKEVKLNNLNFIRPLAIGDLPIKVFARVRYRQPLASAKLVFTKSSVVSCKLIFALPQKFIAPGQSAVFYSKNGEMLGGGIIT